MNHAYQEKGGGLRLVTSILSLLLLTVFLSSATIAGVGGYTFGESAGTYVPITGSTQLVGPSSDDGAANAAIGFNFVYDGITYTEFRGSANGFLTFNTAATGLLFSNSIHSNGIMVCGLWDDLATGPSGQVHYVVTGSAPNRILTVEFQGMAFSGNTTPDVNFQIKLYETTNVIEFVYGAMSLGTATYTASIGLADMLANSTTADLNQNHFISITPAAPATASRLVANNSVNNAAISGFLPSGTTYTFTPPVPISTNKTVGGAGDYTTLQAAFADLRDKGVSSPITVSILSGFTLAATDTARIDHIPGTSSTNTVTLRPAASAAITLTRAGVTNNNFVFRVRGARYVTIDGIGSGQSLTLEYTGTIAGGGIIAQDGTQNSTFKRMTIKASGSTGTTTNGAVLFGAPNTINTINIANNNNTVESCTLEANDPATAASRPMGGVTFNGSTTILSDGCRVINNVIRDWQQNTSTNGAAINGQAGYSNLEISGNEMYFTIPFPGTTATALNGIYTNGTSMSIRAFNNKIHSISPSATATSPNTKAIRLLSFSSAIPSRIYNNFIYLDTAGVTSHTGTAGSLRGISVEGSGVVGVFYNSVRIGGEPGTGNNGSTSCYFRSTSPTDTVMNNNFYNARSNGAGTGKHYAITRSTATGTFLSNYNNLRADGTGGFTGFTTVDQATLADWKTATSQDGNSVSETPNFLATSDLHINPAIATQLESGATPIAGITTDIDGNARNGTTPDIGADEFAGIALDITGPVITYTPLGNTLSLAARTITATIADPSGVPTAGGGLPVLYWRINAGAYTPATATSLGGDQYQFTFGGGVVAGNVVSYYICAQDSAGPPNVSCSPAVGAAGFSANPPAVSTPPTTPSSYIILTGISGSIDVGTGGTYATLTAAFADLATKALVGPVIFNLTDALYTTPAETFPITINAILGASAVNTLTIKPATGIAVVISGSGNIFTLNGASYVIFDGITLAEPGDAPMNNGTATSKARSVDETPSHGLVPATAGQDALRVNLIGPMVAAEASGEKEVVESLPQAMTETEAENPQITPATQMSPMRLNIGESLLIRNASATGSAITFINDATNNAIKNATIESGNTSSTSGTILFSTSTGTLGNSNNTIENCKIRDRSDAAGVPANAVYSSGTALAPNANNTISGCEIFNWTIGGVHVAATGAGDGWVVNPSSFYQTAARTTALVPIRILGGNGHTISGNSIGGSAPNRSGDPMTTTTTFTAILLTVGTTTPTSVQGNTISNLNISGGSTQTWAGISVTAGNVNIGTTSGNTIGGGASAWDTIRVSYDARAIYNTGAGVVHIENNVIGNLAYYRIAGDELKGIRVNAGTTTIRNNIIRDLKSNASSSTTFFLTGIHIGTATSGNLIEGNRINNLYQFNATGGCFNIGMFVAGAVTSTEIKRNLIYGIDGEAANNLYGIYSALGSVTYSNNMIALNPSAVDHFVGGIRDAGAGTNNWFFNSVSLSGTQGGGSVSTLAFFRDGTATVNIKDNIFVNTRTGGTGAHVVISNLNAAATGWDPGASNYNILNGDPLAIGVWLAGGVPTDFATWQTNSSGDANSSTYAVTFVNSVSDLHLNSIHNGDMNLKGIPAGGITVDFDDQTRDTQAPYIGADELSTPLPVQLASFTGRANPNGSGILLEWRTISEINNYGFYVERRGENEQQFVEVPNSFVPGNGTTNEPKDYSFLDNTLTASGVYYYRLRQVDLDGTLHRTEPITVSYVLTSVPEVAPKVFALFQNYPNPFNPSTEIKFSVERSDRATLEVYNLLGQKVATLFDGIAEAGQYYRIRLNAADLASGMYLYRLQSGTRNDLKKMLLLK